MKELIEIFYTGLSNRDAEAMLSCYHDDVIFEDPAFGKLKGDRAKAMWRMLCKNGKDLKIEFSEIESTINTGKAHWEAWYKFSKTGRLVHNKINAQFEFKDGKIIKHIDHFNLHRWASQAIGWKGKLLGGTGFFKKKLIKQTNKMLDKFMTLPSL
ncbi:nuclear transport factor 2 family protein [Aquimarina longa]|uniref:nuclear transport factor 2 family protein n=1 Tax=Aquimarina longa TaxID=1080221 RepID=UPI0007820F2E|nr:nuclear transport factor 2 family protein [Aquimarina longa]